MSCGLLWFEHIAKTGGGAIKQVLQHQSPKLGWSFIDLFVPSRKKGVNCKEPNLTHTDMRHWSGSRIWRRALLELKKPLPRLVVHRHLCPPGLGAGLLEQLEVLNATLARKGCRLMLATVLREPHTWMQSMLSWTHIPRSRQRSFIAQSSDFQLKAIVLSRGGPSGLVAREGVVQAEANAKLAGIVTPDVLPFNLTASFLATPDMVSRAEWLMPQFWMVGRTDNLTSFAWALLVQMGAKALAANGSGWQVWMRSGVHSSKEVLNRYKLQDVHRFWIAQHFVADSWLYSRFSHPY
mmetsp:Transcript_29448/g.68833  ORF Transcript_29448/g.68833 Transcript_29448/m.68833 type:complete len:294 (-) Transcript_29448:123-1004(-)